MIVPMPSFSRTQKDNQAKCLINPKFDYGNTYAGNAGCLLKADNKLLIIRDKKTGKLSPPGGKPEKTESAQCTAFYETLEETGLKLTVGKLLNSFKGKFYLFQCSLNGFELTGYRGEKKINLPVPKTVEDGVSEVFLIDPKELKANEWRFPSQFKIIQGLFLSL